MASKWRLNVAVAGLSHTWSADDRGKIFLAARYLGPSALDLLIVESELSRATGTYDIWTYVPPLGENMVLFTTALPIPPGHTAFPYGLNVEPDG